MRRIVAAAGVGPDDVVLEIGPGLGSLTLGLLAAADRVVAVEIDERLGAALPRYGGRADAGPRRRAARCRRPTRCGSTTLPEPPTAVVANLPYNVSVPVLLHLLARFDSWSRGLVMVQSEVADRLVARPGSKTYGVPSVKMAWYAETARVGTVPPTVFWPVPNVDSGLVAIAPPAGAGDHREPRAGVRRGRRGLRPAAQDAALGAGRAGRVSSAAAGRGRAPPASTRNSAASG